VKLGDVRQMIEAFEAVEAINYHLLTQRRPLRSVGVVEGLLRWPILDSAYGGVVAQEFERDGELHVERARQLLCTFADTATLASGVRLATRWNPHRHAEFMLVATTTVGLYVTDVLARLGFNAADRSFLCSSCDQPYTPARPPREGEGLFCSRPACQRRRAADKQSRYRLRQKEMS
jgi:hypothetical protein